MSPLREGSPIAQGQFVLDRRRALEKLREFQLPSPYYYVLEFVKAATILGASRIDFSISTNKVQVDFDGETLDPEDLQQLYEAAFSHRTSRRQDALRHLAIGVNAAQGLGLWSMRIEVQCDQAHGITLDGEEIEALRHLTREAPGTRIVLVQRPQPIHLIRFVDRIIGQLAEAQQLREKCLYCRVPIFVDGKRLSEGFAKVSEGHFPIHYHHDGEVGVVALTADGGKFSTSVLQHGVLIAEDERDSPFVEFGCRAIVDSPHLTANLSQSAFVEDGAWDALGQRLDDAARLALADYMESLDDEAVTRQRQDLRFRLFTVMGSISSDSSPDTVARLTEVLEKLKIFQHAGMPFEEPDSYISIADARQLDESDTESRLYFSQRLAAREEDIPEAGVLYIDSKDLRIPWTPERHEIEDVLGPFADHLVDLEPDFARGAAIQRNRQGWQRRKTFVRKHRIQGNAQSRTSGNFSIAVALVSRQIQRTEINYIKEDRLLLRRRVPRYRGPHRSSEERPRPLYIEIQSDHMEANTFFDRPEWTEELREAQRQALQLLASNLFFTDNIDRLLGRIYDGSLLEELRNLFEWKSLPDFQGTTMGSLISRAERKFRPQVEARRQKDDSAREKAREKALARQRKEQKEVAKKRKAEAKKQEELEPSTPLLTLVKQNSPEFFASSLEGFQIDVIEGPGSQAVEVEDSRVTVDRNHPTMAAYFDNPDDPGAEAFAVTAVFYALNHSRLDDFLESHRQARRAKIHLFETMTR